MKRWYIYITLLLVLMLLLPMLANAQCAMCNATASTGKAAHAESAKALNNGILFLMAIPYILLTSFVIFWLRIRRQKRKEQALQHPN